MQFGTVKLDAAAFTASQNTTHPQDARIQNTTNTITTRPVSPQVRRYLFQTLQLRNLTLMVSETIGQCLAKQPGKCKAVQYTSNILGWTQLMYQTSQTRNFHVSAPVPDDLKKHINFSEKEKTCQWFVLE